MYASPPPRPADHVPVEGSAQDPLEAPASRQIVLGFFAGPADAQMLVEAVRAANFPRDVQVWIGSYGPNREASEIVHSLLSGRYAPMFSIQPRLNRTTGKPESSFYLGRNRRAFTDEQWAVLDTRYSGEIPLKVPGKPLPANAPVSWGRELGCRFRDSLRLARRVTVDGWQFDELVGELAAAGTEAASYQDFTRGVLTGLRIGRPHRLMGDTPQQGIVWAAGSAIRRLPTMPITPGLRRFWEELDKTAAYLVGQEYPRFHADPRERARRFGTGHRDLLASTGQIRRALGRRYIAGFTPGIDLRDPNLGGRLTPKQTPSDVKPWRNAFIVERARARPAGLAQFCFVRENCTPEVVEHVMEALAKGLRV